MSDTPTIVCGYCKRDNAFTAPVSVVMVFAPGLSKPYPMLPEEDYRVCGACDAVFKFIDRAVDSHPIVREAGQWSRAIVVFQDGHGVDVKARRQPQQVAWA